MPLRVRPMKTTDVDKCVALVETNSTERLRYGPLLRQLVPAWLKLLPTGSLNSTVVEYTDHGTPELLALGVSVFITEEFLCELKMLPRTWIGPTLAKRVPSANSPILTAEQIREANSNSGVNLAIWNGVVSGSETDRAIHVELFRGFFDAHVGYQIKEIIYQPLNLHQIHACFQTGFFWLSTESEYVDGRAMTAENLTSMPFLIGSDRESAKRAFGSWLSTLFTCNPVEMYLRPSEQRLLLTALRGLTDEELAEELGITVASVKKAWRIIYERTVGIWDGDLCQMEDEESSGKRGKEKKQHLLTYLRGHMEELRPILPIAQRSAQEYSVQQFGQI